MFRRIMPLILVVALTMVLTTVFQPLSFLQSSAQQSSCRMFPETGRIVCGKFLAFWEKNGGLQIFGYPISNTFEDYLRDADKELHTVQYFQRAIFEMHPANQPPYDVQLSLTGAFQFSDPYYDSFAPATYPQYPNAEGITFEDTSGDRTQEMITTFRTKDQPAIVLQYYRQALLKQGWEEEKAPSNTNAIYIYRGPPVLPGCEGPPPNGPFGPCRRTYYLLVVVAPSSTVGTNVRVEFSYSTFCCVNVQH